MRRDLVEAALSSIASTLFSDVDFTPPGGSVRRIVAAISGIEIAADESTEYGVTAARIATYQTQAIKTLFPDIAAGALISELDDAGASIGDYVVLDWKPFGDARLEIQISLRPA